MYAQRKACHLFGNLSAGLVCLLASSTVAQSQAFTVSGEFGPESQIVSGSKVDCDALGADKFIIADAAVFSNIPELIIKCSTIEFAPNAVLSSDGSINILTENLISGLGATLASTAGLDGVNAPAQDRTVPQTQNGNPGGGGANGRNASSGVRWVVRIIGLGIKTKVPEPYSDGAEPGRPGGRGNDGAGGRVGLPGIEGGDGEDGGRISITAADVQGMLQIVSPGGAGGTGGKGGTGGTGGNGGRGGPGGKGGDGILDHPAKNGGGGGPGGNGGPGGPGGVGGVGGDGGNGGDISLQVVNSDALEHFVALNPGGRPGAGGEGGNGGRGGDRGPGGAGGCGGGSGDPFRGDGACGGHGGNGQVGGAGGPGGAGKSGEPGVPGEVGILDKNTVPLADFNTIFDGA